MQTDTNSLVTTRSHLLGLIVINIFIFQSVHGQPTQGSDGFNIHFEKAELFEASGEREKAISEYQLADKETEDSYEILLVNNRIASLMLELEQFDSAKYYVDKNISEEINLNTAKIKSQLASSYLFLRRYHHHQGDLKQALEAALNIPSILDHDTINMSILNKTYQMISEIYNELGEAQRALEWINKSFSLAERYPGSLPFIEVVESYVIIAAIYYDLQDIDKSIDYNLQALKLLKNKKETHIHQYIVMSVNLGLAYSQQSKYDSAIRHYEEGLSNLPLLKNKTPPETFFYTKSLTLRNLGSTLAVAGKNEEAAETLSAALEIAENFFGKDHWLVAEMHSEIAHNYQYQGDFNNAKESYLKCLNIQQSTFGPKDWKVSNTLDGLGYLELDQNNYNLALEYFNRALNANPRTELVGNSIYSQIAIAFSSFSGKAQALSHLSELPYYPDSLDQLYNEAVSHISFAIPKTDPDLLSDIPVLLEELTNQYLLLYQSTGGHKYLEKMWEMSEYNKSRKLVMQAKQMASIDSLVPRHLIQREKNLKDSIVSQMNSLAEGDVDSDSVLFLLNKRYDDLLSSMEVDYPSFYDLKYGFEPLSIETVQNNLPDDHGVLSYFQGNNRVFSIYLSKNRVTIDTLNKAKLDETIQQFNSFIINDETDSLMKKGAELFTLLINPEIDLPSIKTLEVIPDGSLWALNFSLLVGPQNENRRFIGDDINIYYEYSRSYRQLAKSENGVSSNDILAFSFNEKDEQSVGPLSYVTFRDFDDNLPGTSLEIREISNIWDGDYYYAKSATESAFKNQGGKYNILHLALHGVADDDNPDHSQLRFVQEDELNDGILHAYEIYNLDLNSDLAVLSACQSGTGKIIQGEGIMSLGRAFAYAGVRSLLLSKWEVSDATTPFIMKYFYQGLKQGMRKSEALRFAKMQFLANDADNITSSPYYWGSFYILGDDSPISAQSKMSGLWWVAIASIIGLIGLILYRRRKE